MLGAGLCARAEPGEARAEAPAAIVDLQRQVNELRSDLLDERERRIARRQEANAFVLVLLGIAIGIGGLWIREIPLDRGPGEHRSGGGPPLRAHAPGPALRGRGAPRTARRRSRVAPLVAAGPESAPASPAGAAANGTAGSAAVPRDNASGQTGPGIDPEELHRHEEAIADCSEAIRLDPRDPALYLGRAEARSAVARFEEAIADYDRAIRLDPDHAGAYLGRCRAKSELGRHEEAVEDYDHAVRLDPDSVAA